MVIAVRIRIYTNILCFRRKKFLLLVVFKETSVLRLLMSSNQRLTAKDIPWQSVQWNDSTQSVNRDNRPIPSNKMDVWSACHWIKTCSSLASPALTKCTLRLKGNLMRRGGTEGSSRAPPITDWQWWPWPITRISRMVEKFPLSLPLAPPLTLSLSPSLPSLFFLSRSGELRTQKLKSPLVRTQSLNVLYLKPGVGQYIAIHATLTARDFFLAYFYPSGPFTCIFSKPP